MHPDRRDRARSLVNAVGLATPLGLLVARAGGARVTRGPRRLLVADGYRLPVPPAAAFTVGDVVVVRSAEVLRRTPRLLDHEARHAAQYACCLGLGFLPLYAVASAWSWLRCGDAHSRNTFERRAGLADGGYVEHPPRRLRLRAAAGRMTSARPAPAGHDED